MFMSGADPEFRARVCGEWGCAPSGGARKEPLS